MPQSNIFDPIIPPIERPTCKNCGGLMWLARIEPGEPGHDQRTFECPECENSETLDVEFT